MVMQVSQGWNRSGEGYGSWWTGVSSSLPSPYFFTCRRSQPPTNGRVESEQTVLKNPSPAGSRPEFGLPVRAGMPLRGMNCSGVMKSKSSPRRSLINVRGLRSWTNLWKRSGSYLPWLASASNQITATSP
jgi:hypothetical protein